MPPILSYAQNQEDVVLWRALRDVGGGFWIDVGAGDPVTDSVTKLFSEHGWHGVNVEPHRASYRRLCCDRPRDVNLNVGVGGTSGRREFFQSPSHPGASTFSAEVAAAVPIGGIRFDRVEVEVVSLSDLCTRQASRTVDFLKVDVEGMELEVIGSGDWRRHRPRIVVVESTTPHTDDPSHHRWEPLLLGHGYHLALFDGVNRFYVRAEDRQLLPLVARPANVLDDFVTLRHHREVTELRRTVAEKDREYRRLELYALELEQRLGAPGGDGCSAEDPSDDRVPVQPEPQEPAGDGDATVGVVIVHRRDRDRVERCLGTLLASEGVELRVVLVANGCPPPRGGAVDDPRVEVVAVDTALDFAEANDLGTEKLGGGGRPFEALLFLNDDTEVEPDAVRRLRDHLRARPTCGVVGPRLRILGTDDRLNSLGIAVTERGECWDEGIGLTEREYGDIAGEREVLAVTGAALMIRPEALAAAGGWPRLYGYYVEDVALCLAVRSLGWSVRVDGDALVRHAISGSSQGDPEFKTFHIWRNRYLLMIDHWPLPLLLRTAPSVALREIAVYVRRRVNRSHAEARLQAAAWRSALRLLPLAVARRRRLGPRRDWTRLLRPGGSTPVILLPETDPAPTSLTTTEGEAP